MIAHGFVDDDDHDFLALHPKRDFCQKLVQVIRQSLMRSSVENLYRDDQSRAVAFFYGWQQNVQDSPLLVRVIQMLRSGKGEEEYDRKFFVVEQDAESQVFVSRKYLHVYYYCYQSILVTILILFFRQLHLHLVGSIVLDSILIAY